MSTASRYIARLYLTNIAVLLIVLFSFIVSVDVVLNLSRFSDHAVETAQSAGRAEPEGLRLALLTAVLVVDLWGPRLLQLFGYLIGVVLVVAMGFTCAQLVRHREFVALLASGVSLTRIALPFLAVAALFCAIQALNQELVVPRVAHLLTREHGESGRRSIADFPVTLATDGTGRVFHAAAFNDQAGTLDRLTVFEQDNTGRVRRVVTADSAQWTGAGWTLQNGRERDLAPGADTATTPTDFIPTALDPTRIKVKALEGFGQNLSWPQINEIIAHGGLDNDARSRLDRARWGRLATLVSNLATVVAALPFFLKRMPGSMLGSTLRASPIAALGLVAAAAAPAVALPGLPAWLGAFVPCAVLLAIASALFTGIRS